MECPHCKKELILEDYVTINVENYRNPALAATVCCGRPVRVRPATGVIVSIVDTDRTADDWAVPFSNPIVDKKASWNPAADYVLNPVWIMKRTDSWITPFTLLLLLFVFLVLI